MLSVGLLTPVPFAHAAVRLGERRLGMVTAGYAIGSLLSIVGAFLPEGGWNDVLFGTLAWCSSRLAPRMRSCSVAVSFLPRRGARAYGIRTRCCPLRDLQPGQS